MEELESSLNLVCILLSESVHPPVIGFTFTHLSFFSLMLMELAALSLHVSGIIFKCQLFSQNPREQEKVVRQ